MTSTRSSERRSQNRAKIHGHLNTNSGPSRPNDFHIDIWVTRCKLGSRVIVILLHSQSLIIQTTCALTSGSLQQNNREIDSRRPALPASHPIQPPYQRHLHRPAQTQPEIDVHPSTISIAHLIQPSHAQTLHWPSHLHSAQSSIVSVQRPLALCNSTSTSQTTKNFSLSFVTVIRSNILASLSVFVGCFCGMPHEHTPSDPSKTEEVHQNEPYPLYPLPPPSSPSISQYLAPYSREILCSWRQDTSSSYPRGASTSLIVCR